MKAWNVAPFLALLCAVTCFTFASEILNQQKKTSFSGQSATEILPLPKEHSAKNIASRSSVNEGQADIPVILKQQVIRSFEDSELLLNATMFEIVGNGTNYVVIPKAGLNFTVSGSSIIPAKDFYGILNVPLTVTDGVNTSEVFNAVVEILNVNDPPYIILPYTVRTKVNTSIDIHISGLFNDKEKITIDTKYSLIVNGTACAVECRTGNGKLTKNQAEDWTSYRYAPDKRYSGVDYLVFYIMDPEGALSNVGRLFFEVSSGSVLLITSNKTLSFNEEQSFKLLAADFTISGITSYTNVKIIPIQGDNYTVVDGLVVPDENFFGLLSVKLYAQLNNQLSDIYVARVNINNVEDAPVGRVNEMIYTSGADRTVDNINIAEHFSDPDLPGGQLGNTSFTVQFVDKTNSTNGVTPNGQLLKKNADSASTWVFKPNPQFVGKETIDVWLTDSTGRQSLLPVRLYFNINAASVISPVRFSPDGGTFAKNVTVSLATESSGSQIRFTTDGSDVTSNSSLYSVPFTLNATTILKAKAFKAGATNSAQTSAVFEIGRAGEVEYIYDDNGRLLRTEIKN